MAIRVLGCLAALVVTGCASVTTSRTGIAVPDNQLLARVYAEDQADTERNAVRFEGGERPTREMLSNFPPELAEDVARLVAVDSIRAAGGIQTANDYYHAAMVYQHGADSTSYRLAYEHARRAVEKDPEHAKAKWLSAAAWDRYLDELGRPQWYGTQYRCQDGVRRLLPVEDGRVTDAERVALGVPTLAEARAREGTACER